MSEFTKDDLKLGMTVEMSDGRVCKVLSETSRHKGGCIVHPDDGVLIEIHSLNDDLVYKGSFDCYDIVKVWDISSGELFSAITTIDTTTECLFPINNVKELTVKQVSDLLGYEVKIVGGV